MRPEHLFVLGVLIMMLAVGMVVGAYSSSNRTMRGPIAFGVIGGILLLWAHLIGPAEGFEVSDVPRLALDMMGVR